MMRTDKTWCLPAKKCFREDSFSFRFFLSLFFFVCLDSHAESLDDLGAIVRTEHTRSFNDTKRLEFSIKTAPLVQIEMPPGGSPSQMIKDHYGFGISNSKESYQLVESRILKINGVSSATQFPSGIALVPDLPTLTSQVPNSDKSIGPTVTNKSPLSHIEHEEKENFSFIGYEKQLIIPGKIENSLVYTRVDRYSATDAARILNETGGQNSNIGVGFEMGIQLSQRDGDCQNESAKVLSNAEKEALQKAIKLNQDKTERYLVVLDTGWPSFEDQVYSLQHMRNIFDVVRKSIRVDDESISKFSPKIHSLDFIPLDHQHACMISNALKEFSSLDKDNRIKILFVPIRPGQARSRELFREILEIDQLISSKGDQLFSRKPSKEEIQLSKEIAKKAIDNLPALQWSWKTGDDVVRVYEPLISGLIRIFDTYAGEKPQDEPGFTDIDARFWLSFSWNFTKFAARPSLPQGDNYMVFAATGNDGKDFFSENRLYAREAISGRRVFAVMNSDHEIGKLTCKSAIYTELWHGENIANVGSFPGRLGTTSNQLCPGAGGGTSFSTPRVAWIAAASDVSQRANNLVWPLELSSRLLKGREKIKEDPLSAPIRILKVFSNNQRETP